jgi:AcrR family transcriptional regulator
VVLVQTGDELQWVKPPRQQRSQETLERILEAAEACISEVGFRRATVAEIVKRADSSVGAFYSRFADKDALLRVLLDRFAEEVSVTIDAALRPELWEKVSFERVCQRLVHFMMRMMRQRAQLIKAIARATIDEPELGGFRSRLIERTLLGLRELIASRGEHLACDNPERALRLVSWMCINLFESSVVQADGRPAEMSAEECEAELCIMILSYLQIETANPPGDNP